MIGGRNMAGTLAAGLLTTYQVRAEFESMRAREVTADRVQAFLDGLAKQDYAALSINKYRTILCSTFAVRRGKYDKNPVSVVSQRKEPPGRDRFLPAEDFRKLLNECKSDPALYAFVWIAATTGARKGEILPRKWKRLPLGVEAVEAMQKLPN